MIYCQITVDLERTIKIILINTITMLCAHDVFIVWSFYKNCITKEELLRFKDEKTTPQSIDDDMKKGRIDEKKWWNYVKQQNEKYGFPDKNIKYNWTPDYWQYFACQYELYNKAKSILIIPARYGSSSEIEWWCKQVLQVESYYQKKIENFKQIGLQKVVQLQGQLLGHMNDYSKPMYVLFNNK